MPTTTTNMMRALSGFPISTVATLISSRAGGTSAGFATPTRATCARSRGGNPDDAVAFAAAGRRRLVGEPGKGYWTRGGSLSASKLAPLQARMPRYRVTLEYDGSPFVGWQVQALGASVQGRLAEAIYRLAGERVTVYGAGRTDAGVHALGQVAHFDLTAGWPTATVRAALNFHLKPDPIAVLACSLA